MREAFQPYPGKRANQDLIHWRDLAKPVEPIAAAPSRGPCVLDLALRHALSWPAPVAALWPVADSVKDGMESDPACQDYD